LIAVVTAFQSPRVKQFERSQQLNCFTLDNGYDALSRNVRNQLSTHAPHNIPENPLLLPQRKADISKLLVKLKTSVEILFTVTRQESKFHFFLLAINESRSASDTLHQHCLNVEYMVILEQEQN